MFTQGVQRILLKYQVAAFKTILAYSKRPGLEAPLESKLKIVGDYPNEALYGQLMNEQDPLCAVMVLDEGSSITKAVQHGETKRQRRLLISIDIFTIDPQLREMMGDDLWIFCENNEGLIVDRDADWSFDMIQSNGNRPSGYPKCYRKSYGWWLNSPAKY